MDRICSAFFSIPGLCLLISSAFSWSFGGEKPSPLPLTPGQSAQSFTIPDDLTLDQVLAEPVVKQPVSIGFDERGRLWVVQYLQYPNPAGLKMVSRDKYWRAVYDKVPPPPPLHIPGKDKITIHEDTDGDGTFDKHSVFLDGLNIVTAAVRGRGGVWVLNPPYLLFYPTKNNADAPTGDPVVHLQGFGLEDTHSVVNSLRWGPDGWLYAAQGSTVTGNVHRPGAKEKPVHTVGQHIWRYHPEMRRYEVFAEGGGNAFGVEFDAQGRLFSGHNGGNTRGFHYVQGGFYRKTFDKHGYLSNPFAFGHFEAMKHHQAPRFNHTFAFYQADRFPEKYRGKLFAVAPLQGEIIHSEVKPDRSSIQTRDLSAVVTSRDRWFRPVDIKLGPDGALYIADWYDSQVNHYRNHEGKMDHDTGRIYRLGAPHIKMANLDLNKKSTRELIAWLEHPNLWHRQTALRLLGDRKDASAIPILQNLLSEKRGQLALEALWALNLSGGFDEEQAKKALDHAEPWVRAWAVRLLGDANHVSPALASKLADLAKKESEVVVRSQLACTARRLAAGQGLPLVRNLLVHDDDAGDIHIPLLLWWAMEANCSEAREKVLALFRDPALWQHRLTREAILARLMRRFALPGTQKDFQTCTKLFGLAPDAASGKILLSGLEEAFKGRSLTGLPRELLEEVAKLGGGSLAFRLRQGQAEAVAEALKLIQNSKAALRDRVAMVETFAEVKEPRCVPILLTIATGKEADPLRKVSLTSLQAYNDPKIAAEVILYYPKWTSDIRGVAETLLSSRRDWTHSWLEAVDAGKIAKSSISHPTLRKILLYKDDRILTLVKKHWGEVKGATTAEMEKEIHRLDAVLRSGTGDPYPGKKLYGARCFQCHALHGKGGSVGPDLTPYKRDETASLLLHIVNPSAEIREGYENHLVVTENGRTLSGILLEKDMQVVVLRSGDGQQVHLPREDVAEMSVSGISLMPEGLLQGLSDQQIRDLFAYLRSSQPLND